MNDKLEALFKAMQTWGYVPKDADYNEFASLHSDPARQLELYNFLKGEKKLSMPPQDFLGATFGVTEDVKKKEPGGQQSQVSQEASLASSSSSTAPAPTAGIVSEPIDPTAGFPEPQKSISQIDPGGLPAPAAPLDPLQQFEGGPTPEFGQLPAPEMQAEQMQRESTPAIPVRPTMPSFDLNAYNNVDAAADELRKTKGTDQYERRKKFDMLSDMRIAKRSMDNAVILGEEANYQMRFADFALSETYGKDWKDKANDPDIQADPEFGRYMTAQSALQASETKYVEESQKEVIAGPAAKRREIQKKKEAEGVSPTQYFLETNARVGARLAAGIMSLPRNLGQAISAFTGMEAGGSYGPDQLGLLADELSQYVDTNFPKTSDLERQIFERVVDYGDSEAVVNEKGQLVSVYGPDGFKKEVSKKEIDEFNRSGLGENAKSRFSSGAAALDQVYNMAGDMFVARGLGGGTKLGTAATTYAQTHADAYNEAIGVLGADPNEAAIYAATTASIQGMLEAYVGDLETVIGKPSRMATRMTPEAGKALMGKLGPVGTAMAYAEPIIKSVVGENVEEFGQKMGDMYAKAEFNERSGGKMENEFTKEEAMSTVLLTTLLTAPLSNTQALSAVDDMKRRAVFDLADNPLLFTRLVADMVESGGMSQEEAVVMDARAQKIAQYAQRLDPNLTDEQRSSALAKEWNRMEAESRGKATNILPAQADEAKKVASKLEAEIVSDIQVKPQPQPEADVEVTVAENAPVAPDQVPDAGKMIEPEAAPAKVSLSEKVVAEAEPTRAAPIEVEQSLPAAFRESEAQSTAVADAYANRDKVSQIDTTDPAVRDEIANIALQELKLRGYNPTEAETGSIQRFFTDSLADTEVGQKVTVDDAFGSLADEYIDTVAKSDRPLRERFDPETVDDTIAAFFAGGGKVSPESFDRWGDPNLRKDKSVTSLYFKKGGRSIEDLANEWINDEKVQTGTLDEGQLVNQIVEFMKAYGKKNVNDYLQGRVAEQEDAKRKTSLKEQFGQKNSDEDFDQTYQEAKQTVEALEIDPETASSIDGWIDQTGFVDESGRISAGDLRAAVTKSDMQTPADADFSPELAAAWDALGPKGQSVLRELAGGRAVSVAERAQPEVAEQQQEEEGKTFEEWAVDYTNPDGSLDVEKIKAEWDAAGEFEWAATVSESAYETIEKIVNDEEYQRAPGAGNNTAETSEAQREDEGTEPDEAEERLQGSDVERTNQAVANARAAQTEEEIEAAHEGLEDALRTIQTPTKVTPGLVAEMMDQGILKAQEGIALQAHLETGEPIEQALLDKANASINKLREVPDWMADYQRAFLAHGRQVVAGTAMPKQLFVASTPDGSLVVGNAEGNEQMLREAGATQQGRAWFVPAEKTDEVKSKLFDHRAKFQIGSDAAMNTTAPAGSFAGSVVRFFHTKFGEAQMRRLREQMTRAKTVDEKLAIAKRMTRGADPVRVEEIAKFLSDKFGTDLVMSPEEISAALVEMGRHDLVEDGVPAPHVRGFVWKGKVYVNMDVADTETPIHEFGHIFMDAIKGTELYNQGIELMRGSIYEQAVRDNPMYEGMSEQQILEEALALAIGQRGAAITEPSLWLRFADFLDGEEDANEASCETCDC